MYVVTIDFVAGVMIRHQWLLHNAEILYHHEIIARNADFFLGLGLAELICSSEAILHTTVDLGTFATRALCMQCSFQLVAKYDCNARRPPWCPVECIFDVPVLQDTKYQIDVHNLECTLKGLKQIHEPMYHQ